MFEIIRKTIQVMDAGHQSKGQNSVIFQIGNLDNYMCFYKLKNPEGEYSRKILVIH